MASAEVCDNDIFLNLDMSESLECVRDADHSYSCFEDLMVEVDMCMKQEPMLEVDMCMKPEPTLDGPLLEDDGFLSSLLAEENMNVSLIGGSDVEDVKLEPTIAEEVEKYRVGYECDMFGSVIPVEDLSPIASTWSDTTSSRTAHAEIDTEGCEQIYDPLSPVSHVTQSTLADESHSPVTPVTVPQRRQQSTKPKLFACHLCTSTFTARFNLNKHIRTVHENLRPFHCDVCGASFQQKCHLKQHKTTVHEHKRPYKCEICELSFGWPAVLNKHIRLKHEKQRPFSCTLCSRTFQQKTHLTQHLIALHEKKKPFSCEQCDQTFNRKERLKKHLHVSHSAVEV